MPQADQSGLVSIKDFVAGVRQNVDIPADMDDEAVARKIFESDPSLMKGVQRIEPRRPMKEPQQGAFDRFTQGMAAVPTDAVTHYPSAQNPYPGMGQDQKVKAAAESQGPSELLDIPNIKKDWQSGNKAGAAGRATTQALMMAPMLKGASGLAKGAEASTMSEMEAIGEGVAKDPYMNITKTETKAHAAALDEQIGNISKSMENQHIDAQKLGADVAYAKKVIAKIKQVPDAQAMQVKAAKDAVEQLASKIKTNPRLMPWADARDALKNVRAAKKAFGPGTARSAMEEIESGLEGRLQDSADAAGQGAAYKKWIGDYRKLSNLQRAGARIMRQQTSAQVETKLTAKEGTRIGTRRFGIQVGDSKAGKIAATNKAMLNKWYKSLQELDQQIKTAPPQIDIKQNPTIRSDGYGGAILEFPANLKGNMKDFIGGNEAELGKKLFPDLADKIDPIGSQVLHKTGRNIGSVIAGEDIGNYHIKIVFKDMATAKKALSQLNQATPLPASSMGQGTPD